MDVELVDFAGVEEWSDQSSAARHPDVLSRRRAQALRERVYRLRHEFHAWNPPFEGFPGEHVVGELRVEHPASPGPEMVFRDITPLWSARGELPFGACIPRRSLAKRGSRTFASQRPGSSEGLRRP